MTPTGSDEIMCAWFGQNQCVPLPLLTENCNMYSVFFLPSIFICVQNMFVCIEIMK